MTKQNSKKTATQSSLAAYARSKKGQTTLTNEGDKKEKRANSPGAQSADRSKVTQGTGSKLTMITNTAPETQATDVMMAPASRSPPDKEQRARSQSKKLKADPVPLS